MSSGILVNSAGEIMAMPGGAVGTDNAEDCSCCGPPNTCQCTNASGGVMNVSGWNVTIDGVAASGPYTSAEINQSFFVPYDGTYALGCLSFNYFYYNAPGSGPALRVGASFPSVGAPVSINTGSGSIFFDPDTHLSCTDTVTATNTEGTGTITITPVFVP
jgi:hypothetical protein